MLVSREMKLAQSNEDLLQRLATRVPNAKERSEFLTEARRS